MTSVTVTREALEYVLSRAPVWREHPVAMVEELFAVKPDAWQADVLEAFPHAPRIALQACAGPGKTATLAWIGLNFMLTRPHPIGGCASISGANLKANLWTELARWRAKSQLLMELFEQTGTKLFARQYPDTWKIEARTFAADADATQIGSALAGLHGDYVLWLLDETGAMPRAVLPVCEGIFAGNPKEAHIVMAGNPETLEGALYQAAVVAAKLWHVIAITADPDDPKRTPRVSVEHAKAMIEQYGRDNPWVIVRILGRFPPSSLNALIGPDEVRAAMKRYYREHEIGQAPRVLGVDVAREGNDSSIIWKRQGIQCFPFIKKRNITSTEGAGLLARTWNDWKADAAFIDNTGGFGSGWIDQLALLGKAANPVGFANAAHKSELYYNKRAEMYFDAVQWIKQGGALPESPELLAALSQTTYTFKGDRLQLEEKAQIKAKIGYSPDEADAFVLTFAEPVNRAVNELRGNHPQRNAASEYKPFAELDRAASRAYAGSDSYDPFRV